MKLCDILESFDEPTGINYDELRRRQHDALKARKEYYSGLFDRLIEHNKIQTVKTPGSYPVVCTYTQSNGFSKVVVEWYIPHSFLKNKGQIEKIVRSYYKLVSTINQWQTEIY